MPPPPSPVDGTGSTTTATYTYGNALIRKDGEVPLFDGLGSERTVTNSNQSVTGTLTTEGFGQTVATTGSSTNPYMFAATSGYRNDGDAGLMHVGARYYDAQVGGFITRDTVLTEHPYIYCNADPVNAVDPTGHLGKWGTLFAMGGAILVGVVVIVGSGGAATPLVVAAAAAAGGAVGGVGGGYIDPPGPGNGSLRNALEGGMIGFLIGNIMGPPPADIGPPGNPYGRTNPWWWWRGKPIPMPGGTG